MKSSGQSTQESNTDMQTETVGEMSRAEFDEVNMQAAEDVAALTASSESLSSSDESLMLEVAMGGMMQLELSRLAVENAADQETLLFAQAEVLEQTGLSEKLMEVAETKGLTLPTAPNADTQTILDSLRGSKDGDFDREYLQQSGVKGHQLLDEVLSRVEGEAEDEDLLEMAATAHPLVLTHLEVAQQILSKL